MLADLWGIDFMRLAERGLGERITGELFGVGMILLIAYLLWELAKTVVAHLSEREGVPAARTDDEMSAAVASRLGTLLPLIRGTLRITILVDGGAQRPGRARDQRAAAARRRRASSAWRSASARRRWSRDIVSGAFFLADDAFRVGEYIEVGDAKGTVEKIGCARSSCATIAARSTCCPTARSSGCATRAATG